MTQVFVNGRFLTPRSSGRQRWAEQMLVALDARLAARWTPASWEPVVVLTPPGPARTPPFRRLQIRTVGGGGGHLWEQTTLAREAGSGVLVNLLSSGPLSHRRMISTFHDAAVLRHPGHFSFAYGLLHRTLRPLLARQSRRLLTVSQFSAGELAETLKVGRERFAVAPNAAEHILTVESDTGVLERQGLARGAYGLCVGNQTANKNVAAAIGAFLALDRPRLKLVIVGAGEARIFGDYALAQDPRIVSAGYLSDGELRALYDNAAFLCFPSRYEGFGIPVVEAMALGCPVIASNAAAIPETAGDAALLVAPNDIDGLRAAMARVLDQPGLAADLRRRGLARAKIFSWDRSAAVLEDLLEAEA